MSETLPGYDDWKLRSDDEPYDIATSILAGSDPGLVSSDFNCDKDPTMEPTETKEKKRVRYLVFGTRKWTPLRFKADDRVVAPSGMGTIGNIFARTLTVGDYIARQLYDEPEIQMLRILSIREEFVEE